VPNRRHDARQEFEVDGIELEELVETLDQNLVALRDSIAASLRTEEWSELARAGHALKGVGANIGQDELRQSGEQIETLAAAGTVDTKRCRDLLDRIDTILAEARGGGTGAGPVPH